jgi:hypothetical protein
MVTNAAPMPLIEYIYGEKLHDYVGQQYDKQKTLEEGVGEKIFKHFSVEC